jgi:hypothetical protein
MIKYCRSCGVQIAPKRLEILPTATSCVPCSTTEKKGAITVMKGEGDHTWVETIFMEREDYLRYMEQENKTKKIVASIPKPEQEYDNIAGVIPQIPLTDN